MIQLLLFTSCSDQLVCSAVVKEHKVHTLEMNQNNDVNAKYVELQQFIDLKKINQQLFS